MRGVTAAVEARGVGALVGRAGALCGTVPEEREDPPVDRVVAGAALGWAGKLTASMEAPSVEKGALVRE